MTKTGKLGANGKRSAIVRSNIAIERIYRYLCFQLVSFDSFKITFPINWIALSNERTNEQTFSK